MHLTTSFVLAVLGASTALALPMNEADNNAGLYRRETGSNSQAINLQRREPKRGEYTGPGGPGGGLWPDQGSGGRALDGSGRMYRRGWRHHGGFGRGGDPQPDLQQRELSDEPVLVRRKHGKGRGKGRRRGGGGGGGMGPGGGGDGGGMEQQPDAMRRSLGEEVAPPAAFAIPPTTGAHQDLNSKDATITSSQNLAPSVTDSAHPAEGGEGDHKKKNKSHHKKSRKHLSKHRDEETITDESPAEHEHGHRHHMSKAHKHRHHKSGRKHKHHHDEDGASDDESVGHHRKNRKHRHRKQRLQTHENPEGTEHAEKIEHAVHEHPEHEHAAQGHHEHEHDVVHEHSEHEHAEPEHEVKHKSKHSAKHRSRKHKKVHPDAAQADVVPAPPSSFDVPSQVVQQRGLQIDELD